MPSLLVAVAEAAVVPAMQMAVAVAVAQVAK
jgi:hypothetical protein